MPRQLTFANSINEALATALELDPRVVCFGLGVDDPKGVFGTTSGLAERFGGERVFDMPTAENGMTGVAVGAALGGLRPVMTHQRLDFFLLALDQLVNNAAKWHYMFGGAAAIPVTIRLILGRGWGQGPTHSQSLQSWFAHVPGLKVVMPTLAADAKGLLLSAIFDDNPVVFLEHRWLHQVEGDVPLGDVRVPLGKAHRLRCGADVTIVSFSFMTVEALHAADALERAGITCDILDLRSIRPLDWELVFASVNKTGRLLALDTSAPVCSVASEIVARVSMECFHDLKSAPAMIALPDAPVPTSPALTESFYPGAWEIAKTAARLAGKKLSEEARLDLTRPVHDVPGDWFKGPF